MHTIYLQLKRHKAFGPDNIPPIIWKDRNFHDILLKLFNFAFEDNVCTNYWLKSTIVPMPKKGDLSLSLNYRGSICTHVLYLIFCQINHIIFCFILDFIPNWLLLCNCSWNLSFCLLRFYLISFYYPFFFLSYISHVL